MNEERTMTYRYDPQTAPFVPVDSGSQTFPTLRLMDPGHLCPDLSSLDYIGPADYMRGRVVRAFFWVMRLWPKRRCR